MSAGETERDEISSSLTQVLCQKLGDDKIPDVDCSLMENPQKLDSFPALLNWELERIFVTSQTEG